MTTETLFNHHRPLLFSIAYEMLGSVADTEDVLQDSYIRWQAVDLSRVNDPRAYLARIVTRQSLNCLRSIARRREEYVGPWLPEPLHTPSAGNQPAEHLLTGEAVTTAMLLVLESLTPTERAVFVLREVFDFSFTEIASAVDRTEAAVRQILHRARSHVHARRPHKVANPLVAKRVTEQFLAAAATGDVHKLMALLAPEVVSLSDGGGVISAARHPIVGAESVARFFTGLVRRAATMGEMDLQFGTYNSMPALVVSFDGITDMVTCFEISERITAIYNVRNPNKLRHIH